jgi:hypothetical protein
MVSVAALKGRSRAQRIVDARAAFTRLMSHEFDISSRVAAQALDRSAWMGTYYLGMSDEMIKQPQWRSAYTELVHQAKEGWDE